jgi:hypothetical protein
MQQSQYHRKFCDGKNKIFASHHKHSFVFSYLAREIITDKELRRLTDKYHNRHPTFSIDLQERTCKTIIFACIYHYRHIEVDLRCQCIYDDILHKFQYNWSTDNVEYKKVLQEIFLRLNSSTTNRSVDDQIESIINQITKYFTQLKPIQEGEQQPQQSKTITTRITSTSSSTAPIEIVKYEQSPQSRRRVLLERSLSWSQPLTSYPIRNKSNSILIDRKKKS